MTIDFVTYQLQQKDDREIHSVPGVLVEHAARTTHRHRNRDMLAMYLSFSGEHRFPEVEVNEILHTASGIFFHTQGSVTHAIQQIVEFLNKQILEWNLDRQYEGVQVDISVNITVLHQNWLFIGQVGNAQVYSIGEDRFERFGDQGESIERLGVTRRVQPRLFQCEINEGDLILMAPHAHASWKAYYLAGTNKLEMAELKAKLKNQMIQDFSVLVIKAEPGSGKVRSDTWNLELEKPNDDFEEIHSAEKPEDDNVKEDRSIDNEDFAEEREKAQSIEKNNNEHPTSRESLTLQRDEVDVLPGETETYDQAIGDDLKTPDDGQNNFIAGMARLWMKGKTIRAKIQLFVGKVKSKIFSNRKLLRPNDINTVWIVIVILIPIIISVLSLSVYSRFGKEEQYQIYMKEARALEDLAEIEGDAVEQQNLWSTVFDLTVKAEEYKVTNDSRALFLKAQTRVDDLGLTARLDFRPALAEFFPEAASISQIESSSSGVYLLDSNSGNVLRMYMNPKGFYQLDEEFKCTPGPYGLVTVTNLIDFEILPANAKNYKVMAMDGQGNLLYCQPGELPASRTLTKPNGGWGQIVGSALATDMLYVADSGTSQVWVYGGSSTDDTAISGIVFAESPVALFDDELPDLGGAAELSINQEDLYLLHHDGHMTLCQYKPLDDGFLTECEDPAPFTDNRAGSENKHPWIFLGTHFVGLQQTLSPNASIFTLDEVSSALYQFSFQLNLERTYKPQLNRKYPIPTSSPTGFGITQDNDVFLAYGNQLFIAPMQ